MTKYLIIALTVLSIAHSQAQNPRADTSVLLSVHNTGVRFKLIPADFGANLTQSLVGTMVRSYDTVMVIKTNNGADTSIRKPIRYTIERRCDVMSQDINGKIVVMEFNKDCDVTQTCLNVQRAGAKAFVIIHNSNSQGNIKLPKKGLYKDSIRIPIFTVGSNVGDSITLLLPSVVGIKVPVLPPPNAATNANDNTLVATTTEKSKNANAEASDANTDLSNTIGIGKQGFVVSPNPTHNQAIVTYQFSRPTDATIEVKTSTGQVIYNQILRGATVGNVEIATTDYPNGTYFVTLSRVLGSKEVTTKKLVVQH